MFVTVTFENSKKGAKSLYKRITGKLEAEKISIREGEFYHLNCFDQGKKTRWKKISKAVGREKNRLLLPMHLDIPKSSGIKRYDKNKFEIGCLTDLFCEILSSVHPGAASSVVLVDETAAFQNIAERLIGISPQLIVYTNDIKKYEDFRNEAVYQYGTEPIITDRVFAFSKALAILAPLGKTKEFIPPRTPVFGPKGLADYYIDEDSVVLPDDIAEVLPCGISKVEFLAALHERCGIKLESKSFCKYLCKNGGKSSIKNVVLTFSVLT